MAYVDFTYYATSYLGNAIAEADFPRLANKASQLIDIVTFNRAKTDTDNIVAIKNATCAVAEEILKQEQAGGIDGITSESQGQHSVSFGVNSSQAKSNQSKLEAVARFYLSNTFLMYSGFTTGEYGDE